MGRALGWAGGRDQPPGGTRTVGGGHGALPPWCLIVAWNLICSSLAALRATDGRVAFAGCPLPERGQAWAPFPALPGKVPGPEEGGGGGW